MQLVIVDGHYPDGLGLVNVSWVGTLEEFLEANEGLDADETAKSLDPKGDGFMQIGGGAAYACTVYREDVWKAAVKAANGTRISVINPWSGAWRDFDRAAITQDKLDAWAQLMDSDVIEAINDSLPEGFTPSDFVAAWVERVGPEKAGLVMIGS